MCPRRSSRGACADVSTPLEPRRAPMRPAPPPPRPPDPCARRTATGCCLLRERAHLCTSAPPGKSRVSDLAACSERSNGRGVATVTSLQRSNGEILRYATRFLEIHHLREVERARRRDRDASPAVKRRDPSIRHVIPRDPSPPRGRACRRASRCASGGHGAPAAGGEQQYSPSRDPLRSRHEAKRANPDDATHVARHDATCGSSSAAHARAYCECARVGAREACACASHAFAATGRRGIRREACAPHRAVAARENEANRKTYPSLA